MPQNIAPSPLKRHIKESPQLQALRHARHKGRRRLMVLLSIFCIVFVSSFIIIARNERMQIHSILVSGNEIISTDAVREVVEKKLSGNYAYIVPRRAFFIYPKQEILFELHTAFPRFQSIQIKRHGKNELEVGVVEERGMALWCGQTLEMFQEHAVCYFTDDSGKIIDGAPLFSGNMYTRFVGGVMDSDTKVIGQHFVETGMYGKLLAFAEAIRQLGFSVRVIELTPNGDDRIFVDTTRATTAQIRFKESDTFEVLSANLKAALSKDELAEKIKNRLPDLEYFDLRFTNKVYYKFAND